MQHSLQYTSYYSDTLCNTQFTSVTIASIVTGHGFTSQYGDAVISDYKSSVTIMYSSYYIQSQPGASTSVFLANLTHIYSKPLICSLSVITDCQQRLSSTSLSLLLLSTPSNSYFLLAFMVLAIPIYPQSLLSTPSHSYFLLATPIYYQLPIQ